jgi:hypothetical protein
MSSPARFPNTLVSWVTQQRGLPLEDDLLVVERDDVDCSQNRFAEPPHSKKQQRNANDELKWGKRNALEERTQREGQQRKRDESCECACARRSPAADGGDRQHEGDGLNRFDQCTQECSRNGREGHTQGHHAIIPSDSPSVPQPLRRAA